MLETSNPEVGALSKKLRLAPTPPIPEGLRSVELSENARTILNKRYVRRLPSGELGETADEMFWRVAYHVAAPESDDAHHIPDGDDAHHIPDGDEHQRQMAEQFYDLLVSKRFFPNSPTFTGAGTPLGQLAACFVLPISDDMGRDSSGIFQTLRDASLIQQTGGGNGFSFSRLRHRGSLVKSSAGVATGPVGFLRVYDKAFGEIAQGGTRRGANMAVLRVDHPDIRDFITCKSDENQITNFNISVGVTDEFMQAVKDDATFDLIAPDSGEAVENVQAREIFDLMVDHAHRNGEPGILFLDEANRSNPVPHLYQLEATNPCGEQWLGPYENCCLGSVNLAEHFGPNATVDWDRLEASIVLSTRFLDNVVSANAYVPAVPQLREAASRARRIGLGIMGLGDLMYHVGVRYGSDGAQEFAAQIMEFVRFHSMVTSIELAEARGPFEAIAGSIYDPADLRWSPPTPLTDYHRHFGRPELDWAKITKGIERHGIRNAAQTTIAPTGTIATVAGCEGYGCEPVFALAYFRHVDDHGEDLKLTYTSPLFESALAESGVDQAARERIIEQVMERGTCQDVEEVPEHLRHAFVVSQDIAAEEHVRMQAAMQAFVDNSLSKTCNFPEDATEEDVAQAYLLAWDLACKGLTVYVTGSRQKVVLETQSTASKKLVDADDDFAASQFQMWMPGKKPRPRRLEGSTFSTETPLGKAFVTINQNGGDQPFEVFITTAKAGSETAAVSEAIGRLISYILRIASPVMPRERLEEVVRQLSGIGGGRPTGFGVERVLSLPDGVAQSLMNYLGETEEQFSVHPKAIPVGDLCPDCGAASMVNEEGCRKCYSCGFSEC